MNLTETLEPNPIPVESVIIAKKQPKTDFPPLMDWLMITRYCGYVLPVLAGTTYNEMVKIVNESIKWN